MENKLKLADRPAKVLDACKAIMVPGSRLQQT